MIPQSTAKLRPNTDCQFGQLNTTNSVAVVGWNLRGAAQDDPTQLCEAWTQHKRQIRSTKHHQFGCSCWLDSSWCCTGWSCTALRSLVPTRTANSVNQTPPIRFQLLVEIFVVLAGMIPHSTAKLRPNTDCEFDQLNTTHSVPVVGWNLCSARRDDPARQCEA